MGRFKDLLKADHIEVIKMPRQLDAQQALSFSKRLASVPFANSYIFDFHDTKFAKPFGTLVTANSIKNFKVNRSSATFASHNFGHLTYLAQMGFFNFIGLRFGKTPGEAKGNINYEPVRVLNIANIKERADREWVDIAEIVDEDARNLASVLARCKSGELVEALAYSIRELIRNVVEHSGAQEVLYCAQYWQGDGLVEIAVADGGIGLHRSLSRNPNLVIRSDQDALNLAILPGISGVNWRGKRKGGRGDWENSGYGLYMTSRLCGDSGAFTLASGDFGIVLQNGHRSLQTSNVPGTAVRLQLDTKTLRNIKKRLNEYSVEGAQYSKELGSMATIEPSAASIMLGRYLRKKR